MRKLQFVVKVKVMLKNVFISKKDGTKSPNFGQIIYGKKSFGLSPFEKGFDTLEDAVETAKKYIEMEIERFGRGRELDLTDQFGRGFSAYKSNYEIVGYEVEQPVKMEVAGMYV